MLPVLLIVIVFLGGIKVDHIRDGLEFGLMRVPGLQDYHDAELPDVEEVNQALELVLRELWAQHEGLEVETTQEKLYSVRLDDVIGVDQRLPLQDSKLKEGEQDYKFLQVRLTLNVVVL